LARHAVRRRPTSGEGPKARCDRVSGDGCSCPRGPPAVANHRTCRAYASFATSCTLSRHEALHPHLRTVCVLDSHGMPSTPWRLEHPAHQPASRIERLVNVRS
jgi:hypothetical protein